MASGAISFSPSNLHSCSTNCLEKDVADLILAWETFECKAAPKRKKKSIIIVWNSRKEEKLNSPWRIYSNLPLAIKWGEREGSDL